MISISVFIFLLFTRLIFELSNRRGNNFIQTTAGGALFALLMILSIFGSLLVIGSIWKIIDKKKSIFSRYKILFRVMQIILYSLSAFLMVDMILKQILHNKFDFNNDMLVMALAYY